MKTTTACSLIAILLASIPAGPVHGAERPGSPPALTAAGDGAAGCAAAKTAFAFRPARAAASAASANFDVTYYHLDLLPDLAADSIAGVVRVAGRATGSPLTILSLDLAASMHVTAVSLSDGTPLSFTHPAAVLNITLPAPVAVGAAVAVDVTYSGRPVVDGFGNFVFGKRTDQNGTPNVQPFAWSLSEPYGAREWWPCKDHPSDKADSVRVTVTVPDGFRVGSQGLLESETSALGMTTYDWVSHYPISNYLISVAIGDYVRYQDTYVRPDTLATRYGALALPLDHLVYNDTNSQLPGGWSDVGGMLTVFEDWFGPYPFANEKYGHAEFTFGGGMEHQTMSSMGTSAPGVVAHELAHQWYGDSISPQTWPHIWLNEGFATYAEYIYWTGCANCDSLYPGVADAVLSARYTSALRATGTLVVADTSSVNNLFDPNRVYAKGSMVLHMLRYVVGDATFRDILEAWAAEPSVRYGVATTADFQRVAETISGLDLDTFFRQWVTEGTGYPSYRTSAQWEKQGNNYRVWVSVAQTQPPSQSNTPVFEMPLDILVTTTGGGETFRVMNDRKSQVFEVVVASQPSRVILDPDSWVLHAPVDTVSTAKVPAYPAVLALSPNPARNAVLVQFSPGGSGTTSLDIFDVRGRRVHTQTAPAASGVAFATVDTSRLASGVYFLRISNAAGKAARKFVVVR
ncbi:MAG TPA: M1 family aminopeptidase [Candidatus Krumholzibacteria bacterium]|nr:M1 family aminopeptidase [Candidatus Krumholzibacteria bacterium]